MRMLTSDFSYSLPSELIAQHPLAQRDASRMMVVDRKKGKILHYRFKDLPEFLGKEDVLVLNNTKVIPAKAWGKKGGREIEFLFLKERKPGLWEVLCRPAKKVTVGDTIIFERGFEGEVVEMNAEGNRVISFSGKDVLRRLKDVGFAPLPPYIKRKKRKNKLRRLDIERYQTVYARKEGAIAAPTAGLHFTPSILEEIKKRGIISCEISLKVGLATFQPVRAERIEEHRMLEESYMISRKAAQAIMGAKKDGRPVVAVGTTVVRALESAYNEGNIMTGTRSTRLFIFPGFEFKVVDRLLTNFHLPKSTLLMLVSAFAGLDLIKKAYEEAVRQKYRFYSYGDCMLIV